MGKPSSTPTLYTVREVAEALRIHQRTAYRLITGGSLGAIKIGSQWRVPEKALMEFIETGWRESAEEPKRADRKGPRQLKLPLDKE